MNKNIQSFNIDPTIPSSQAGYLHPLVSVMEDIRLIMSSNGFIEEDGPCIEEEKYNFDYLNIPEEHPARDMHATFYIDNKILRSHTTNVQTRVLESHKHKPPFSIFSIGSVYRRDDSPRHSPMFHQMEVLSLDYNLSLAHLKEHLLIFFSSIFDQKVDIRYRPSYFPFTEPSIEVDIKFNDGPWLEVMGAGMVRKNIFQRFGYDTNLTGIAYGIGVERIAMIKYGIKRISDFYNNPVYFINNYNMMGI